MDTAKEMNAIIPILADKLRQGNVVAFLGAGASRTYVDDRSGKTYPGLPSASEIVQSLSKKKPYINENMSFPQVMFMVKQVENRNEVERILEDHIDAPTLNPLPVHQLLADMSFSAFITTNYDRLLEKALEKQRKKFISIIEENDVSRWRNSQLPVIKIHGCVSRPKTMIAAEDEYRPLSSSKPVMAALLTALLANKTVLFLGFSLADDDFRTLYQELKGLLGNNMPTSYAIVRNCDDYQKIYWGKQGVDIIEDDLTRFLRMLFQSAISGKKEGVSHPNDDWMSNSFFESLHEIRTKPSETQVINAFLEHLLAEMQSPALSCEDIIIRASSAVDKIIKSKPNLQAFKKIWTGLSENLKSLSDNQKENAEEIISDIISDRKHKLDELSRTGKKIIKKGSNILVYSQSIQMLEVLKSVPRNVQDTCKLFVCECRPKSPSPFQDGIAICEYLKDTGYTITLVPDVTLGNLMARNQINIVVMGAHSVYFRNHIFTSFVNTCGTNIISLVAANYNIPVYVIAEDSKILNLENSDEEEVSYEEEENIFGAIDIIGLLHLEGINNVSELNIGYDLCKVNDNIKLISIN